MEIWITVIGTISAFLIISFISLKINEWLTEDNTEKVEESNSISDFISDISLDEIKYINDKETIDNINNLLNKLIADAADSYRILMVDNDSENLTERDVESIEGYIKYKVSHNMTPAVLASLSLIYDVSSMEKISTLLDEKIKIYMVSMIVSRNKYTNNP